MTVTDEMVERAAIVICNYGKFHSHNAWLYAEPSERDRMRELARAALEAACLTVPSLPEEIAGLIERLRDAAEAEEICDKFSSETVVAMREAADALRALTQENERIKTNWHERYSELEEQATDQRERIRELEAEVRQINSHTAACSVDLFNMTTQHKALMVAAKVLKRYSDYADVYDVLAILR